MEDVSREAATAYVQAVRACGYVEVVSETEAASAGMMFEKDGAIFSIAHSEGVLTLPAVGAASA